MKDVLDMVVDVGKEWKELGLALCLRKPTLDKIDADNNDVSSCKREMLSKWLCWVDDCEKSCNWQSLAEEVKKLGYTAIANAIKEKYLKK